MWQVFFLFYVWDNGVTSISVQCLSLCFILHHQLWTDVVVCGKSWMLYTRQRAVHMLRNNIYQPRWGAALISVQCCAELCSNIACVCNGKRYELNVGVCSRGGDHPLPLQWCCCQKVQSKSCSAEWVGGAGGYSRLATIRPQLQHSVINKQVADWKKNWFSFHLLFDFLIRLNWKWALAKAS